KEVIKITSRGMIPCDKYQPDDREPGRSRDNTKFTFKLGQELINSPVISDKDKLISSDIHIPIFIGRWK
ncbi:hypothetical protein ISN44_As13g004360, partial [Arabidopsis suecica]